MSKLKQLFVQTFYLGANIFWGGAGEEGFLHSYRTYILFIGWYALNVPYLKGTVCRSIEG